MYFRFIPLLIIGMSHYHCSAVLLFGASFGYHLPLWSLEHTRNVCRSRCFSRKEKWSESCSVLSDSLRPHGLYSPWNSPGQNTGVGSLSLLQGIFPTHGLNPGLPHCRQILYLLSHKGSPRILEWVVIPSPVNLPDPGIKPGSPALQEDSLATELSGKPKRGCNHHEILLTLSSTITTCTATVLV